MKRLLLALTCLFAMMLAGTGLKAQEVTIRLMPGWNWIAYPYPETVSLETFFGDFSPMNGDLIDSQFGYSMFDEDEWFGEVDNIKPGRGYVYYSSRTEAVNVVLHAPASQVSVTTAMPTDITTVSAIVGGMVTLPAGGHVFLRGVCWGTEPNPDVDGGRTSEETGIGSFTSTLEALNPNTTYYVRAYAVSDYGLTYGNEVSFTTVPIWTIEATPNPTEGGTITGTGDYEQNAICILTATANVGYVFANWTENGEVVSTDATYAFTVDGGRTLVANFNLDHTYVDLGLPSGLLWATCNVGADIPEEYGDYFAWGETQPKDNFSWTNYQYCMGSFNTLTKYCNNPDIGYNGFTDDLTTLLPEDDAATANWGDNWRMPTEGEWQELYQNTTVTWTMRNGVRGRLFTASNGNSIFLPASGYCNESVPEAAGIIGDYWTSSLDTDYPSGAMSFFFNSSNYYISFCNRLYGRNVRAVRSNQDHPFVDLGLPSGTLWAVCNVGANSPEDYGDYFAWGETQPKDTYNWSTYQYCNGSYNMLTKYCSNSDYGYNGFTDNLTTLLPEDDAATVNWGSIWRMPTQAEFQELLDNTTVTWTTQNGVNGRLFTASNGNSLFLPAAGIRWDDGFGDAGVNGGYWSSSLYTDYTCDAWELLFDDYWCNVTGDYDRVTGWSVRPVRCKNSVIDVTTNPVEGGTVSGGGIFLDHTSCTISAIANEDYAFMSWTENGEVVSFEATYTFIVNGNRHLVANFVNSIGGYGYVDLGLPSGLLWATSNVGADYHGDYGDYFAWGETQPKDTYNFSTYQYANGSSWWDPQLTKYCSNSSYGYNGFTDNLTTLEPSDDAATANWGSNWRMPTYDEWIELFQNTTCTWTMQNGVNGALLTANNGNCIFLPSAGCRYENSLDYAGDVGIYWSSSLYTDYPYGAWGLESNVAIDYVRSIGLPIRPVRSSGQSNAPTGAINGKFTVNDNGDQVYFSQGNLQYQASTNTWKFAENQYDYIGSTNSNISSTYSGWIDLFGWGTSGWNSGNIYYQPWSSAGYDESSYGQLYGPLGQYNLTGSYANADWGVYNPISNGGNTANQWRTLTQPEWNYVFNTRTTTSGIRYAKANVNNVNGVILLPDDWSTSTYSLSNTNSSGASFSSNTLTASQWSTLEQAGAVFLPAAGSRDGTSVSYVGSNGYYWSASYYSSTHAYFVFFYDSNLGTNYGRYRYSGLSVRLVRFAEN